MAEAEEKLEVEGCGFLCVHEKVVEKVQHELPHEETLLRLADLFKVFGDGTRVRILFVLLTAEKALADCAVSSFCIGLFSKYSLLGIKYKIMGVKCKFIS